MIYLMKNSQGWFFFMAAGLNMYYLNDKTSIIAKRRLNHQMAKRNLPKFKHGHFHLFKALTPKPRTRELCSYQRLANIHSVSTFSKDRQFISLTDVGPE